jgi:predicted Ser/Thr protein kinase
MTGDRQAASPLRPRDPTRLGDYELIGRLGEGGMGTVYLARDPAGTRVAVKMVRADLAPDEEFRLRFRSEVERARQVPPFCTAEVLDADPEHDPPYLVCEYVDGPSLAEVVSASGPLTAANLHSVAIGVATALTAIHGAGVIHRDLQPRNVLLAPGSPKVIDFGVARALEATSGHTRTGQMVGTVAYMSPERFGSAPGTPLTAAADVFAWGGVVAYAGTGRTPFNADSPTATAARILTQPPDLTGLSGPLRDLVDRALAKDPADRPTARELLDLLVDGQRQPAAAASALADQPGLRAAAEEAQAAAGPAPTAGMAAIPPVGYAEDSIVTAALPPVTLASSPSPARRGPRWLVAVVTAVIMAVGLGGSGVLLAVLMASGGGTAGDPRPAATHEVADPTLLFKDPLTGPRLWQPNTLEKEQATCTFSGSLVVWRNSPGSFRCSGPVDVEPNDLTVDVDVRLLSRGSCAGIWFRFRINVGYQLRVCERALYVGSHKQADVEVYKTMPLDDPIPIGGAATAISLEVRGDTVTVSRDGTVVGRVPLTDAGITGGRVILGIFTQPRDPRYRPPFAVSFQNIEVHRL